MNSQTPEQSLEWVYEYRLGRDCAVGCWHHFIGTMCLFFILLLILAPLIFFGVIKPGESPFFLPDREFMQYFRLGMIVVLSALMLIAWLVGGGVTPSRKLRITRQTITLTDTGGIYGPQTRHMTTTGAKFRAVYLDSRDRLLTYDTYRMNSAYQIEITRNSETFLFPCDDETQQRQILKTIDAKIQTLAEGENV